MRLCSPRREKGATRMQPFQKLTATRGRLLLVKEATEERALRRVREGLEESHLHRGSEQGSPDLKMAAAPSSTPASRTPRHKLGGEGGEKEDQVEAVRRRRRAREMGWRRRAREGGWGWWRAREEGCGLCSLAVVWWATRSHRFSPLEKKR
jgi:hypothetical protein